MICIFNSKEFFYGTFEDCIGKIKCKEKYLKAEKKISTKESFQCFYVAVVLIDSVYRKDEKYYLKVFLEKFIHNFFRRSIRNFGFLRLWKLLLKYEKSFF